MLTGKKNNHFELNAGGFMTKEGPVPILNFGYRFHITEGGLIFRANAGIIALRLSLRYAL